MENLSAFNKIVERFEIKKDLKLVLSPEEELETAVIRLDKNLDYMNSSMSERNRPSEILLSHIEKIGHYVGVIFGLTSSGVIPEDEFHRYLKKVNVQHNYENLLVSLHELQSLWDNVDVSVRNKYSEYFYVNYIALKSLVSNDSTLRESNLFE